MPRLLTGSICRVYCYLGHCLIMLKCLDDLTTSGLSLAEKSIEAMRPWVLGLVDGVSLLAFTWVGVAAHRSGLSASVVLRAAGPFLSVWFVLVPVTSVYRRPGWGSLVRHWLLVIPLAVLGRQVLLGRPLDRAGLVFLAGAVVSTGLFLAAGRVVATRFVVPRRAVGSVSHKSL